MAFSTNNDLNIYAPEVFGQGVEDWSNELALAETDVINQIKIYILIKLIMEYP